MTASFEYLDVLRKSGVTNMYGSAAYLMRDLGRTREQASREVVLWMKTFSDEAPKVRAKSAIAKASA